MRTLALGRTHEVSGDIQYEKVTSRAPPLLPRANLRAVRALVVAKNNNLPATQWPVHFISAVAESPTPG
jgi:hypothetical protein